MRADFDVVKLAYVLPSVKTVNVVETSTENMTVVCTNWAAAITAIMPITKRTLNFKDFKIAIGSTFQNYNLTNQGRYIIIPISPPN